MSASPVPTGAILRSKLRRDLRTRRRQVIAVAATVFIGVGLFVIAWDMYNNLQSSYDLTYDRTNFADVWITGDDDLASKVAALAGVDQIETRTSGNVPMRLGDGSIQGRIQGIPIDTQPDINQLVIDHGTYLNQSDPTSVLIESHTAANFELSVGDTIELNRDGEWFEASIVGIVTSPEWLWIAPSSQELLTDPNEFGIVFAAEDLAASLASPGSHQIVVQTTNNDPDLAASMVDAAYRDGATEAFDRAHHPSDQALQNDVKGFKQMAILFPLLFLSVAALATSVLLGRLIHLQRGEIGMLRAFGFDEGQILRHFVSYGLVTTLMGAIPAIILGSYGAGVATKAYTSFLSIPFSSQSLSPTTWLIALIFSLVLGAVAGYLPARAAASIEPAAAMRPIGPETEGRRTFLERLLPSSAPTWAIVAVRNIRRQPRRAASTMIGVVLALIMMVSAFVMNDSINSVFDRQYAIVDQRDLVVTSDQAPIPGDVLDTLMALDGVAGVEPYEETPILLRVGQDVAPQQLQAFVPGTQAHDFVPGLWDSASKAGPGPNIAGIVVGLAARDSLNLEIGDTVQVEFPALATANEVRVIGFIDEPIRGFSYLNIDDWETVTGIQPSRVVLTLDSADDHRIIRNQVADLSGVLAVQDQIAVARQASTLLAATKFFVAMMLAFAMFMAVALIFNAMTVSIAERESEVATLQANGVDRGWIRKTITLENLVIVLAGVIPGLLLGRVLGGLFLNQFSTPQFKFEAGIDPWSVIASAALVGVAAVLAQFPGLRSLDKLDLAAKVRERNV